MALTLFSLDGKVALVTGANGGLGLAMARGLRDAGATVCVTGRDPAKNAAVAREFGADAVFQLDVTDERAVAGVVGAVVSRFGRLDVLVANAGNFAGGRVHELTSEGWRDVLDAHLTGPFFCAKHASAAMIERGEGGKIILIGSIYAQFGPPDFSNYAAAKAGQLGLMRSLAVELCKHDIQVNAILPGYFDTDMSAGIPAWLRDDLVRKTPAGRFGQPDELVGAAVFLASAASHFVTGAAIVVDGGYSVADRMVHGLPD
ncbi:MAG TPA: SDR family NAD(P)-dependent oxidoreductase [Dehalococcoidia bacterium]|nr:SDR family NAD(P)-dependent oxidoreductase [Dehalococcoidia bacterium]